MEIVTTPTHTHGPTPSHLCNDQLIDPFAMYLKNINAIRVLRATSMRWAQSLVLPALTISPECYHLPQMPQSFGGGVCSLEVDARFKELCRTTKQLFIDVRTKGLDWIVHQIVHLLQPNTKITVIFYVMFCGNTRRCSHGICIERTMGQLLQRFPRLTIALEESSFQHECNGPVTELWSLLREVSGAYPTAMRSVTLSGQLSQLGMFGGTQLVFLTSQTDIRSLALRDHQPETMKQEDALPLPLECLHRFADYAQHCALYCTKMERFTMIFHHDSDVDKKCSMHWPDFTESLANILITRFVRVLHGTRKRTEIGTGPVAEATERTPAHIKTFTFGYVGPHAYRKIHFSKGLKTFFCGLRNIDDELDTCVRVVTSGAPTTEWHQICGIPFVICAAMEALDKHPKLRIECYFTNYFMDRERHTNLKYAPSTPMHEDRFLWKYMPLEEFEEMMEAEERALVPPTTPGLIWPEPVLVYV